MAIPALVTTLAPLVLKGLGGVLKKWIPNQEDRDKFNADALTAIFSNESILTEARAAVIEAEAKGESWLQRNWRPITMLFFLVLLGSYWFGFAPAYLVDNPEVVGKVFTLLQIGIGGYIGSRGMEKIVNTVAKVGGVKKMMG